MSVLVHTTVCVNASASCGSVQRGGGVVVICAQEEPTDKQWVQCSGYRLEIDIIPEKD